MGKLIPGMTKKKNCFSSSKTKKKHTAGQMIDRGETRRNHRDHNPGNDNDDTYSSHKKKKKNHNNDDSLIQHVPKKYQPKQHKSKNKSSQESSSHSPKKPKQRRFTPHGDDNTTWFFNKYSVRNLRYKNSNDDNDNGKSTHGTTKQKHRGNFNKNDNNNNSVSSTPEFFYNDLIQHTEQEHPKEQQQKQSKEMRSQQEKDKDSNNKLKRNTSYQSRIARSDSTNDNNNKKNNNNNKCTFDNNRNNTDIDRRKKGNDGIPWFYFPPISTTRSPMSDVDDENKSTKKNKVDAKKKKQTKSSTIGDDSDNTTNKPKSSNKKTKKSCNNKKRKISNKSNDDDDNNNSDDSSDNDDNNVIAPWMKCGIYNNNDHNIDKTSDTNVLQFGNGSIQDQLDDELYRFACYVQLNDTECQVRDEIISQLNYIAKFVFLEPNNNVNMTSRDRRQRHRSQHLRFSGNNNDCSRTDNERYENNVHFCLFGSYATKEVCTFMSDIDLALSGVPPSCYDILNNYNKNKNNTCDNINNNNNNSKSKSSQASTTSKIVPDTGATTAAPECNEQTFADKKVAASIPPSTLSSSCHGVEENVKASRPSTTNATVVDLTNSPKQSKEQLLLKWRDALASAENTTTTTNIELPEYRSSVSNNDEKECQLKNNGKKVIQREELVAINACSLYASTPSIPAVATTATDKAGDCSIRSNDCNKSDKGIIVTTSEDDDDDNEDVANANKMQIDTSNDNTSPTGGSGDTSSLFIIDRCGDILTQQETENGTALTESSLRGGQSFVVSEEIGTGVDGKQKMSCVKSTQLSSNESRIELNLQPIEEKKDEDESNASFMGGAKGSNMEISDNVNNYLTQASGRVAHGDEDPKILEAGSSLVTAIVVDEVGDADSTDKRSADDHNAEESDDDDSADKMEAFRPSSSSEVKHTNLINYDAVPIVRTGATQQENRFSFKDHFSSQRKQNTTSTSILKRKYSAITLTTSSGSESDCEDNGDSSSDDNSSISIHDQSESSDGNIEVSFSSSNTAFGSSRATKIQPSQFLMTERRRKELVVESLGKLCRKLRQLRRTYHNVIFIKTARVPIIKVTTMYGFEADIAIAGCNGTDTSLYASQQVASYKSFGVVVLFLKILLRQKGLDVPFEGGLGSYKLYVLVAHHIRKHLELGGADRPGEILMSFLYRYGEGQSRSKYRDSFPDPAFVTVLHQDATLNTYASSDGVGAAGAADLSNVYRIDLVVRAFKSSWERLVSKTKSIRCDNRAEKSWPSILGELVDGSRLEVDRDSWLEKINSIREKSDSPKLGDTNFSSRGAVETVASTVRCRATSQRSNGRLGISDNKRKGTFFGDMSRDEIMAGYKMRNEDVNRIKRRRCP